jgi:hypothetical protein
VPRNTAATSHLSTGRFLHRAPLYPTMLHKQAGNGLRRSLDTFRARLPDDGNRLRISSRLDVRWTRREDQPPAGCGCPGVGLGQRAAERRRSE